jgi:hypothetical protein
MAKLKKRDARMPSPASETATKRGFYGMATPLAISSLMRDPPI